MYCLKAFIAVFFSFSFSFSVRSFICVLRSSFLGPGYYYYYCC